CERSHARERSPAQEVRHLTRWSVLPLGNRRISRAGMFSRSGIVKSHAREWLTAQKLPNLTRGNVPPLGNRRISRAGTVHHSGIVEFHALGQSTAQKLRNLARGSYLSLKNCTFLRAGFFDDEIFSVTTQFLKTHPKIRQKSNFSTEQITGGSIKGNFCV